MSDVPRFLLSMFFAAMLGATISSAEARFAILVFLVMFNSSVLAKRSDK